MPATARLEARTSAETEAVSFAVGQQLQPQPNTPATGAPSINGRTLEGCRSVGEERRVRKEAEEGDERSYHD